VWVINVFCLKRRSGLSFVLVIIDEKTVNSCFDGQVIGFMADSVGLV
jgi:hypothetical protein